MCKPARRPQNPPPSHRPPPTLPPPPPTQPLLLSHAFDPPPLVPLPLPLHLHPRAPRNLQRTPLLLQVDVGTLKAALFDLPTLGQASATGAYTKLVTAEVGKAEQILLLVQTPEETLEATVAEIRRSGAAIDLQKILQLKGLKQGDSDRLLEAYSKAADMTAEMKKNLAANIGNIGGKKIFGLGSS